MTKASVDAQSFYSGPDKLSTKFSPDFTSNAVLPQIVFGAWFLGLSTNGA